MPSELPAKISACVIAMNEADRIGDCLRSVAWCDEIVVVDSHSSDATREIATELGARVIERDWPGYAAQKDFAVGQASYNWVLCVDADERVSPELVAEIQTLRAGGFAGYAGWRVARLTWYEGAWVRHGIWYPDWNTRLFDRRRGRWHDNPLYAVHEGVALDGRLGTLKADLWHLPYRDHDEHLRTIDQYTTIIAEGLYARGRRANLLRLYGHPAWGFFRSLILQRGFLDGARGWRIARLHAYYVRMKYAKLKQLERQS